MKNIAKKDNRSLKSVFTNNLFIIKLCFTAAPLYSFLIILRSVIHPLFNFFEHAYGVNYVLESVEFGRPFIDVFKYMIFLITFAVLYAVLSSYLWMYLDAKAPPLINKKLKSMLYEKSRQLDLECYDNPEYYNNFILSVSEAENVIKRGQDVLSKLFEGITMLFTTGVFFFLKDATALLFIIASFILTFIFSKIINKLNFEIRLKENPVERKRNYIHRVFYLNDYAKEIRLNPNISDKLFDDFKKSNNELYEINKQYAKKRFILGFIRNYLCNDFLNGIAYVTYLVYRAVVVRAISYSSVVVLYNSVWTLKGGFYLLMDIFPLAIENSLYIDKINDFLAYKTKIISEKNLPVPNQPTELELKDVSFAYNQNDGNIINNLNLKIEPYKKIALVGYNGAGKTTLVKLLMRLYDPSCGAIYVNNTDIKDYNVEDYRDKIGTIFQDFKIFAATIKENVLLDQNITADNDKLLYSLNKSGFDSKLTHLKNGVDTNLTTEFEEDGINLSGGESQKLAIARAFYKNSNLIILDEPSSALDPIAEYSVNKAMLEAAKEKTVIFISHRLSTTRNADEIYMLENGRIIECGTHNELLTLNGKYAQMWEAQSRNYTC